MPGPDDTSHIDETRRTLDRLARETGTGMLPSGTPDGDDPIEYWGTRIGKALGIVITCGLLIWFATLVFNR